MNIQFPLKHIDQNKDKTAEHWFDHYSVEINKTGHHKIPLLNKDLVEKSQLIRFRGLISNQLNNEYFDKMCQFREIDDVKQPENKDVCIPVNQNRDIMQRFPMIIRAEPNQTPWTKSILFGQDDSNNNNQNQHQYKTVIAKFYCHTKLLKICDSVEIYGIWSPKKPENESTNKENENKDNKQNVEYKYI